MKIYLRRKSIFGAVFFTLSINAWTQVTDSIKENKIEEVVITALGISKKKEKIGYATQEVDTKQFESITTPNISNLFSGQVSGLNVSNPPGMQQAPVFTLRGNTNLIIVIDGVIVDHQVYESINPNNIENINVLKGATASALYGSRGRYGAVLITTKNAKKRGLSIEFSQNLMLSAGFVNLPKTQKEFGNGSQGKYEFWDGADGGINDGDMIWGPRFSQGLRLPQWNSPIRDKHTGEIIPWYGSVSGTQYDDKSRYERVPIDWKYHDNLSLFLTPAIIYNNNLSIAYKNKNNEYRIAANYLKYDDRIPEAYQTKSGLTISSINKLSSRLTFDTKLNYTNTFTPNTPNYNYNPSGHMYTILIWMGGDVNGNDLKENLWIPGKYGTNQANWNYAWYNNPWFGAKYYKNRNDTDIFNAQTGLNYEVNNNLNVKGKISLVQTNNTQEILSPKSYFNYSAPRQGGYEINDIKVTNLNYDVLATYKKRISDDIDFTINAGGSGFYYSRELDRAQTDGLTIPQIYTLENSTGDVKRYHYLSQKLIYSLYSSVDLGIFNSIFFNISGRNDWSSTLPKQNRSYFYPSASVSAVLSNVIPMPRGLDMLKLSASWAKVAYDFNPYAIRNYYHNNGGAMYNGHLMYSFPNKLNFENSVEPEKTRSYEFGLSFGLLKNRILLDATYFNTLDYDNILEFPSAQSSGYETQLVNGNKYTNKGVELSLTLIPIRNKNFTWKALINWSTFEQKLTEIYGGQEVYKNLRLNERTDSYYDVVWKKSPDGKLILDSNTGMPTREVMPQNLGHLNPDWTFGFTNNFKFKKLTFSIGIDGSIGGIMRSEVVEKMWWGGKHPNSVEYRDREYATPGIYYFVPDGVNYNSSTNTYTPHTKAISFQDWAQNYPYRARVTQQESEQFANIFDRTFIKLRSVLVGYDFSSMLNPNGVIRNLSINVSAYNLWMWKKSKHLYSDPDYKVGSTGIGTGATNSPSNDIQDPASRWIGLGFTIKF